MTTLADLDRINAQLTRAEHAVGLRSKPDPPWTYLDNPTPTHRHTPEGTTT